MMLICGKLARPLFLVIALLFTGAVLSGQNPVPFVNQPLNPAAATPGGAAFTLALTGSGFVSGATVRWNGSGRPTTFVNSRQLTASIPAADIAVSGSALITVANPAPGGGVSNAVSFQITVPSSGVAFGAPTSLNLVAGPPYVGIGPVAADVNNDGKIDLVTTITSSPGTVAVSLGNGDGTFQSPVQYQYDPGGVVTSGPGAMVVADVNGDGNPDIVLTVQTALFPSTKRVQFPFFLAGATAHFFRESSVRKQTQVPQSGRFTTSRLRT